MGGGANKKFFGVNLVFNSLQSLIIKKRPQNFTSTIP